MHQPINNFEPCVLGECLLDGFGNELYLSTTCDEDEFNDLAVSSQYLPYGTVTLKSDVVGEVDTIIRKMCYGVNLD